MIRGVSAIAGSLSNEQIVAVIESALAEAPEAKKILVLTTDYSRADFTHLVFSALHQQLGGRSGVCIDVLNTAGTHRKMTGSEFKRKLGGSKLKYPLLGKCYQHYFSSPKHLEKIGTLSSGYMSEKTAGYIARELSVVVNKRILLGYDLVVCISGTIPHEGTGFSGGTKILFPGIAGEEVIGGFHWAAVLIGIPNLIGTRRNAARDIVDSAASLVFGKVPQTKILSLNMVYAEGENHEILAKGLFWGYGAKGFDDAHEFAASLSSQLHIVQLAEGLQEVVQHIPPMYDEWWTAMKGSYKLQKKGVLSPGARVILYAPHIHQFHSNPTMDKAIREIGYHGRDFVIEFLTRHPDFNLNVASHVINARGIGNLQGGREEFPFELIISSQIPPDECRKVGLGYIDPAQIRRDDFNGNGKLWIEQGGQALYSLRNQ